MRNPKPAPQPIPARLKSPLFWLFAGVFWLALALYLATLAPGVVGGDSGEHQLAAPLLGIPHTTGYPLYILTGKLWTMLIPVGTMAWRMNLFSAVGGALAAALTALVIARLARQPGGPVSSGGWPGAIIGGLALACGLTLWQWSVIAGVRSFNIFFFALLTLEAIIWAEQLRRGDTRAAERTLRWLALPVGLSLAHHRTTVFYLPSLVGWIAWHNPRLLLQPKRLLTLALLSLLPLLFYAFIYFRGVNQPPYTHEIIRDWPSFWFLVGSGDSQGLFFSIDPAYLPARLAFIWADVLAQLSWPGVILAVVGAGWLARRQTAHFIFQLTLVLLLLWFTLDFEVVNLNEAPTWYLMPAYFIFALWLGVGVNGVVAGALRLFPTSPGPLTIALKTGLTVTMGLLLAVTLAWPNWQVQAVAATAPLDDWRQLLRGVQAERFVQSSLPLVEPDSIIWGDWEQYTPVRYYQLINGQRPDVTIRLPLDRWPEKVAAAHAAGQPVYLAPKPADLNGTPYHKMVGRLLHVGTAPNHTPPADMTPLAVNFEDELELMGYRAEIAPQPTPGGAAAGPILQLTLVWRAPQKIERDYALSLRLEDAAGTEIYKKDAAHPVLSSYPTTLWSPGEVVADYYELPLPPGHGPLTLRLIPYRTEGPGQWHNLTPLGAAQPGLTLGPFGGP
jgi:hypothetical protein